MAASCPENHRDHFDGSNVSRKFNIEKVSWWLARLLHVLRKINTKINIGLIKVGGRYIIVFLSAWFGAFWVFARLCHRCTFLYISSVEGTLGGTWLFGPSSFFSARLEPFFYKLDKTENIFSRKCFSLASNPSLWLGLAIQIEAVVASSHRNDNGLPSLACGLGRFTWQPHNSE